eukprot:CAMPEP_0181401970 /NCGR_PEP_ID=MMETSP1110-20121109/2933_1 /TAXON_ID=174948 /ORGANISM="Symbiodinium sp., Strain CCMP421" /LENGTH=120 /DNA_ID=CAMNT_0023524173 /DNA_START=48 /DNA_END=411 /DNA_ORIENTATION=+
MRSMVAATIFVVVAQASAVADDVLVENEDCHGCDPEGLSLLQLKNRLQVEQHEKLGSLFAEQRNEIDANHTVEAQATQAQAVVSTGKARGLQWDLATFGVEELLGATTKGAAIVAGIVVG